MIKSVFPMIFACLLLCGCFADQSTKDGLEKEFWPNGKLKTESFSKKGIFYSYFYFENGHLGGSREMDLKGWPQYTKDFYMDGKLLAETISQDNNVLKIKEYYPSGQLSLDRIYKTNSKKVVDPKTGELMGGMDVVAEKLYDEQGNILGNGIHKKYDESGKLRVETIYKDGRITDTQEYDENGNLITKK